MTPELRCIRCDRAVELVVRMENGELWCEACDEQQPAYGRWERKSEPMNAETVYRQRLSDLRRDLQALQKQADTSTREWEREDAEKGLAKWLPEHDQMVAMFKGQGWRIPNPGWKLKTAMDRAEHGQVHVDPYDLDILATALARQQWALEPDSDGTVTMLLTPALEEQFRSAMLTLGRKVTDAGGFPRSGYSSFSHAGSRKCLALEPGERWLLHHLAVRQTSFLDDMAARESNVMMREMITKQIDRWRQLRDLTKPPVGIFAGARLVRLPSPEERKREADAEKVKRFLQLAETQIASAMTVLGTGKAPSATDVFDAVPGLIWILKETLAPGAFLKVEAREHFEEVLHRAEDLRAAIDDLEAWLRTNVSRR